MSLNSISINRLRNFSLVLILSSALGLFLLLILYSKKVLAEEYIVPSSLVCFIIGGILGAILSLFYTYKSILNKKSILNISLGVLFIFISSLQLYAMGVLFSVF